MAAAGSTGLSMWGKVYSSDKLRTIDQVSDRYCRVLGQDQSTDLYLVSGSDPNPGDDKPSEHHSQEQVLRH